MKSFIKGSLIIDESVSKNHSGIKVNNGHSDHNVNFMFIMGTRERASFANCFLRDNHNFHILKVNIKLGLSITAVNNASAWSMNEYLFQA